MAWVLYPVPTEILQELYSCMNIAGLPIYTEYPGFKHNIWSKAYNEPGLFEWLFEQRRRAYKNAKDNNL
ncbi:hypothetical protein A3860_35055 [Niastella vici]|uniref:Dienelactone hydrolase domain-containing protein n=1 Tax=Niastella vici TaxID=1703345 RepID=A0A1V9FNT0_9BACT|nr:hypothetical protein A3860_35055 [Niastella vici]